jgi:hypothetical protein
MFIQPVELKMYPLAGANLLVVVLLGDDDDDYLVCLEICVLYYSDYVVCADSLAVSI